MVDWIIIMIGLLFMIGFLVVGECLKRMMIDQKPYRWAMFIIYALSTMTLFVWTLHWVNTQ